MKLVVVGGTSGMGAATVARRGTARLGSGGRRAGATIDVTDASVRAFFERTGALDHLLVTASPGTPGPLLEQEPDVARTSSTASSSAPGCAPLRRAFAGRRRLDHLRHRRRGGAPAAWRRDGRRRVRGAGGAHARTGARARPAARERHPPWIHRQRDVGSPVRRGARGPAPARGRAMPVRRMGQPEDIADAALFLMTNPQVTGAVLEVSGGEPLVEALHDPGHRSERERRRRGRARARGSGCAGPRARARPAPSRPAGRDREPATSSCPSR